MGELKIEKSKNNKDKGQPLFAFDFFKKLKGVKNIELVISVILGAIILLIYFGSFSSSETDSSNVLSSDYISSYEYASMLEEKLSRSLSAIAGAGKVEVMVTLESGPELVIATSTDKKTVTNQTSSGGSETVTVVENPIIVTENGSSKPLVLMEILPKVKGVIVVSQGADNVRVKLDLLNALQALLSISSSNIQIFSAD